MVKEGRAGFGVNERANHVTVHYASHVMSSIARFLYTNVTTHSVFGAAATDIVGEQALTLLLFFALDGR
jgi:hypothetical protein